MIDSYTTTTEVNQGEDRTVKTSFQINMMGHIVPDSINTSIANMNKFYSKSAIKFGLEVAGTEEILLGRSTTAESTAPKTRFYDAIAGKSQTTIQFSGMTNDEREYLGLSTIIDTNHNVFSISTGGSSITFENVTISTPPPNFPALGVQDFQVYINGVLVEPSAITSISQVGSNVVIDFGPGLDYTITNQMEITVVGKFIV
jgi:hypothetical protein